MTDLFVTVLNMSLTAGFVILAVLAVRLFLRRAPKRFSYLLWAVALFRLLCPFTVESVLSLVPIHARTVPENIGLAGEPAIQSGLPAMDSAVNRVLSGAAPNLQNSVNPMQVYLFIAAAVWAAVACALLLYALASYARLRLRLRVATPVRDNIYETDRIRTAFVLGFFRPRIYLPLGLAPQEADYIILHEQTHIRRLDYLVKPLAFLALCIHWFNPLVWAAFHFAMKDMEMSCDESVLLHSQKDIRADYSKSLLALSQRQSGLLIPLAFGENSVGQRVKNVVRCKRRAVWASVLALALVVVAAAVLVPNAAQKPQTPSSQPVDMAALRGEMLDFAFANTLWQVPYFQEGDAPKSAAAYLDYVFVLHQNEWDFEAGVSMSDQFVEDAVKRSFGVEGLKHEGVEGRWEYAGGVYRPVPMGLPNAPVYAMTDYRTERENGRTVSRVTFDVCEFDDGSMVTEEFLPAIREEVKNESRSLIKAVGKERIAYYLSQDGSPVFLSHTKGD